MNKFSQGLSYPTNKNGMHEEIKTNVSGHGFHMSKGIKIFGEKKYSDIMKFNKLTVGWSGWTWIMNWYAGMTQWCNTSLVISSSSVTGSGGNMNPSPMCSSDMLNCQKNKFK